MSESGAVNRSFAGLANLLVFVRFSHTVFAMPFALGSMLVAACGVPSLGLVTLVVTPLVYRAHAASNHVVAERSLLWPTAWMLVPLALLVYGWLARRRGRMSHL